MSIRPNAGKRAWWIEDQNEQASIADEVGRYGRVVQSPYGDNPQAVTPLPTIHQWLFPPNVTPPKPPLNPLDWGDRSKWSSEPVEQGENIDKSLVQIGNSPFWRSSDEPVEPWDCSRWPNSPYCGGQYNPFATATSALPVISATSALPVISQTQCEICVSFQPNFLGIDGPIARVCYRRDSDGFCQVPDKRPDNWKADEPEHSALSLPVAPLIKLE